MVIVSIGQSLYLTNGQSNHKIIREIVYEVEKEYKENLKPFFLTGISDDILVDAKLENYIEKNQKRFILFW